MGNAKGDGDVLLRQQVLAKVHRLQQNTHTKDAAFETLMQGLTRKLEDLQQQQRSASAALLKALEDIRQAAAGGKLHTAAEEPSRKQQQQQQSRKKHKRRRVEDEDDEDEEEDVRAHGSSDGEDKAEFFGFCFLP